MIAFNAARTGHLAVAPDLPMATWKAGADAADLAFVLEQFADYAGIIGVGVIRHDSQIQLFHDVQGLNWLVIID